MRFPEGLAFGKRRTSPLEEGAGAGASAVMLKWLRLHIRVGLREICTGEAVEKATEFMLIRVVKTSSCSLFAGLAELCDLGDGFY